MGFLATFRRKRAARRYAQLLPRWLVRSYGASERYPVRQLEAAITALKLPREFASLAYAAFLSAEEYEATRQNFSPYLPYDEARALFLEALPRRLASAYGAPTDSIGATDRGYDGGGGHG